ncbi:Phospholysine phosphohistidine inorganic pyrophosphate phosphatase [Folsomia candida]|uniref:Phospholysine phosphohistidine inorganic pyrophosphate phosphatase n=1 Tax=Folsomia candida TaxID=158441 RepID=A0A226D6L1_FOLCA|nr:Phospholysine phosphohistidine inorganic pyrophosphate phosphatase [Folsomia candida]
MDSSSSSWVTEGKPIKGVLLDISGVLRDGNSAIPGSLDAFHKLVQSGIQVRLVTNESQVTRKDSLDKLTRLGFQGLQFDKIFAPAPLLAEELVRQGHRPHLLVHPRVKFPTLLKIQYETYTMLCIHV